MEAIKSCCEKKNSGLRDMMFREGRDDRGGQISPLPAFPGMQQPGQIQPLPAQLPTAGSGDNASFSSEAAGSSSGSERVESLISGLAAWAV